MRLAAANALARAHDPDSAPVLLRQAAREKESHVRAGFLSALAAYTVAERHGAALAALDSGEGPLVELALDMLGMDPTREVCQKLAGLLPKLAEAGPGALARALRLLGRFQADRLPKDMAPYFSHASSDVRLAAIEAVGRSRRENILDLLKPLMTDSDSRIRTAALAAIQLAPRWIPEGGFIPFMSEALQSRDRNIVRGVLQLLQTRLPPVEFPQALAALGPLLQGTDDDLREEAAAIFAPGTDQELTIRVARAQGFLAGWLMLGPLAGDEAQYQLSIPLSPEDKIAVGKKWQAPSGEELSWGALTGERLDGWVEFFSLPEEMPTATTYLAADVRSPQAQTAYLSYELRGDVRLWINGNAPGREEKGSRRIPVNLQAGVNRCVARVYQGQNHKNASFKVRLTDAKGNAVDVAP
jgi:hypothetical protein